MRFRFVCLQQRMESPHQLAGGENHTEHKKTTHESAEP